MLGQRAEWPQAGAQRQHHVRLGNQLHACLGALVAQRTAPQRVAGREAVVVLVAVDHRCPQPLGQRPALRHTIGHHHATARHDDREPGLGQQLGGTVQTFLAARTALQRHRAGDFRLDLAIEVVARDVELRGAHFRQCPVKAAPGVFGHARRVVDVRLILGEFLEHGQLVAFLKAPQPHRARTGLGRNDDHRTVRPVCRRNGRDTVADARTVLPDDHALAAAGTRVAVCHVGRTLLMHHRNEADARRREDVHRIHEGRPHDAENVLHPMGHHGLHESLGRRHFLNTFHHLPLVFHHVPFSSFRKPMRAHPFEIHDKRIIFWTWKEVSIKPADNAHEAMRKPHLAPAFGTPQAGMTGKSVPLFQKIRPFSPPRVRLPAHPFAPILDPHPRPPIHPCTRPRFTGWLAQRRPSIPA